MVSGKADNTVHLMCIHVLDICVYICVFKNLLLGGIGHEDLVKLELLQPSAGLHVDAVLIRGLHHLIVTLQQPGFTN